MRRMLSLVTLYVLLSISDAPARSRVIVLPPDASAMHGYVLKHIVESVQGLTTNDRLLVYVARPFSQIAEISRPNDPTMNKARANAALAAQLRPVQAFLTAPPSPSHPEPPGNLGIPFVVEELARNLLPTLPEKSADILLVGSWLFWDRRDQRTAMTADRLVPSDAVLRAPRSEWPFSVVGAQDRLVGSTLHFLWPNGQSEFESAPHEERVRRWWSIWTTAQSGKVGTLTFDLALAFKRFNAGESSGQPTYTPARDGKPEMIRVGALMPAALPISFDVPSIAFLKDDAPISKIPPATTRGIAWIGIKWATAGCDLDLYARGDASKNFLFYGMVRTDEGRFNKDWLSATSEGQFEFIEFLDLDLSKSEAWVNVHSCNAPTPPEAVVRIWFSARVYQDTIKLTTRMGNSGAKPMTGPYWTRINLLKVVGLAKD